MKRLMLATLSAMLVTAALPPSPALAAKVMEIDADNLVRGAGFMKDTLGLTPNQQTLWQQVASKSAGLLRARQTRREKLQASLKAQLQNPARELRNLSGAIEAEVAATAKENTELRELWLTVNDALNDQQRLTVNQFLVSQLDRVDAPERAPGAKRERGEPPQGGQRRQKPGADMGAPRF